LGIGIDKKNALTLQCQICRKVEGGGGLSHTAFLVHNSKN
jgi:hypothetical protein